MNRNEEYQKLLQELETPSPAAEHTLTRAKARNRRRKWIVRPVLSLACIFACFVLLINISAPAASACSRIPILKDLAELLRFTHFSPSIEAAIENDYVQSLNLQQTQNGITVSLDYVIVDQKQVNVFYHITAENPEKTTPEGLQITSAGFYQENGEAAKASIVWNGHITDLSGVDVRTIIVDFYGEDTVVPAVLLLKMDIAGSHITEDDASSRNTDMDKAPVAFEFTLRFDPQFYNTEGKILEIDQKFELDDQKFTLTTVEIYPTYLQFNLESDPENNLILKDLEFYLADENGDLFQIKSAGICALADSGSQEVLSYRTESPWFYSEQSFRLILTGVSWESRDNELFLLNLKTGETEGQPDSVREISVSEEEKTWTIVDITLKPSDNGRMKTFNCFDADGNYFSTYTGFIKATRQDPSDHWLIYLPADYDSDILYLSQETQSEWSGEIVLDLPECTE